MSQDKQFQTQDLNLSAVLVAQGFNLVEVIKNQTGKATFYFEINAQLNKTI
ncbi:MAG: DUF5659 domain-containing protein [bacterium]